VVQPRGSRSKTCITMLREDGAQGPRRAQRRSPHTRSPRARTPAPAGRTWGDREGEGGGGDGLAALRIKEQGW